MSRTSWLLQVVFTVTLIVPLGVSGQNSHLIEGKPEIRFENWLHGIAVCAGIVLDESVEVKAGLEKILLRRIKVEKIFVGEPTLDYLYIPENDPLIETGSHILFSVDNDFRGYSRSLIALDTPENRNRLTRAIESSQRAWYESEFLDKEAVLDLGAELLQYYLQQMASRFPNSPYLGKDAIKNIKIQHCPAPSGVFIRIMEDFEWRGRLQQMQPMPNQNGIIFWVAAAPGDFYVGHPIHQLGQSAFLGWASDESIEWEEQKHLTAWSSKLPGLGGPLSLKIHVIVNQSVNGELSEVLSAEFHNLRERLQNINADPPRDLAAAIAEILDHHTKVQSRETVRPAPSYGTSRLGRAYEALSSVYAQSHFSDEQKHHLVPLLIDLLVDRTIVLNELPSDGPIIASHHRAYSLLQKLIGKSFPAPIPQKPIWGRQKLTLPAANPSPDEINQRLAFWKNWWETEGKQRQ